MRVFLLIITTLININYCLADEDDEENKRSIWSIPTIPEYLEMMPFLPKIPEGMTKEEYDSLLNVLQFDLNNSIEIAWFVGRQDFDLENDWFRSNINEFNNLSLSITYKRNLIRKGIHFFNLGLGFDLSLMNSDLFLNFTELDLDINNPENYTVGTYDSYFFRIHIPIEYSLNWMFYRNYLSSLSVGMNTYLNTYQLNSGSNISVDPKQSLDEYPNMNVILNDYFLDQLNYFQFNPYINFSIGFVKLDSESRRYKLSQSFYLQLEHIPYPTFDYGNYTRGLNVKFGLKISFR